MTDALPGRPRGRAQRQARGSRCRHLTSITIGFEADLFEQLATRAQAQRVSLAELVRTYCQWGIDTEDGE